MSDLALAFLWHQHQPYYPDDVAGDNPMPWVRLHGVKDYYGMALHLLEFPEMRCTINLVPSLIIQLQAYTERGATDRPLQVARIPAGAGKEYGPRSAAALSRGRSARSAGALQPRLDSSAGFRSRAGAAQAPRQG